MTYDALNRKRQFGIDEWGAFGFGGHYSLSMFSVIEKHQSKLRVSPRKLNPNLDCVWKQMGDGRSTLHILPSINTVFCCHCQWSKHTIAEILSNTYQKAIHGLSNTDQKAILGADSVMWSANS
jgi:hypothetical protein